MKLNRQDRFSIPSKIIFALLLIVAVSAISFLSVNTLRPGYIILKDGTKQTGLVEVGSLTDQEIKLKFSKNGKETVYKPNKLRGYGFEALETSSDATVVAKKVWKHYESLSLKLDFPPKAFAPKGVFMWRTVEGHYTLYTYYYEQPAKTEQPMGNCFYLKNAKGKLMKITRTNFKKKIRRYTRLYSAMYQKIGKAKFRFENLPRLIRDYNYWIINQHDPTTYKMSPANFHLD
ncbi:MAG: hypothetical protein AB8G15_04115 [Saprospiraceae bacterium]